MTGTLANAADGSVGVGGFVAVGRKVRAMSVAVRVIPCLDVQAGRVVKGVNFVDLRDAGDPVELGHFYDAEGADELTFLDISASVEGRETTLDVVRRTAETVFIPLTVGGGVTTVHDVDVLLRAGADKVAINTGAIRRPDVIAEITRKFGNQVLVLSVDARRAPGQPSGFEVTTHGGRTSAGLDAVAWARRGVELGVGEILLNSMDADGTTAGFDLEMIDAVRAVVDVPLIASGGAGRAEDFPPAIEAGADAVLAATVFHFGTLRVADVKAAIAAAGSRSDDQAVGFPDPEHEEILMRVWLPYADAAEAAQRLGGIPDGVQVDCYRADGDDLPDSIGEVELYVLPYMKGAEVLDRAGEMTRLKVIQTLTAGVENFLPAVPDGVTLCNAAGVHDASTAELALALALASGRHLDGFARNQTTGTWSAQMGTALADQRVLILGYGRIGEAIERRLAGFEVASVTRVARRARTGAVAVHPIRELSDLLPHADVVFVIAPLTPDTDGLIDAAALALLPDGALLVNVARGKLVDTDALVAATAAGRIRAAVDVTDPEPLPRDHPLWRAPGVLISPHVGGASSAFAPRADRLISAQLRRFAAGDELENVI